MENKSTILSTHTHKEYIHQYAQPATAAFSLKNNQ